MKTILMCLLVLTCAVNWAIASPTAVVEDDFNAYANGSIVGQSGWTDHSGGNNFVVQGTIVLEGSKALYNNTTGGESVVRNTAGGRLKEGRQAFYIRTENRSSWSSTGKVGICLFGNTNGGEPYGAYVDVTFEKDGRITFYDPKYKGYVTLGTYEDNTWTLLEVQWVTQGYDYPMNEGWGEISYTLNGGVSSAGKGTHGGGWLGFQYLELSFTNTGSGGVYFDALGANPIPEPATISLLALGLLFLRRR